MEKNSNNVLETKIALLYKTEAEWEQMEDYIPLKGEVCFCPIPAGQDEAPVVLFKVGNGVTSFKNLKWSRAVAYDVFRWAKKEFLEFEDLTEEFKEKLKDYLDIGLAEGKVDRVQTAPDGTVTLVYNEMHNAGLQAQKTNDFTSGVEVDGSILDGAGVTIYEIENETAKGSRLEVTSQGIYYTNGEDSILPPAARQTEDNELVTKKEISGIVGDFADIAYSGNVNDLIQTPGDVLFLNCNF